MAARSQLCRNLRSPLLHAAPASRPAAAAAVTAAATAPTTHRSFSLTRPHLQQPDSFLARALASNKEWASGLAARDPSFFPKLASGQKPPILWLGCADSRVPETTILGLQPGDVFTHRNIANSLHPTDLSMLSIVQYAVAHVGVRHVVVCGHTSCGGIAASLANGRLDVLDVWLQPLRALREEYAEELAGLDDKGKADFLARANVRRGVDVLRRIPAVIDAQRERGLQVHGLLFDLGTGVLEDVEAGESEALGEKRIAAFHRA